MDVGGLRVAVERARRWGAAAAEVAAETVAGTEVSAVRGRSHGAALPERRRARVRVWLTDGRSAASSWSDSPAAALVDEALARAPEGPVRRGPVERTRVQTGGLGIVDRRYGQITAADRAEVVAAAERAVRQVSRTFTPSDFTYTEALRVRRYVNSRGVALEESDTTFTCRGTVAADGLRLSDTLSSRSFSSVASLPLGLNLARRLLEVTERPQSPTGPLRVVLPPLAVARLFDWITSGLHGAAPFFVREDAVLDPRLHLQDDGALPGGLRTASFDDCGMGPAPLLILREGRPHGRYRDGSDAAATGHEREGGVRPTNLLLRAGTRSLSAALMETRGPVLVLDDLDPVGVAVDTGRFSGRVCGHLRQGSRRVGGVRDLPVVADLARSLAEVVEVCADTDRVGHVDAPALILDGFSVDLT